MAEWRPWFAWRPVRLLNGRTAWLRWAKYREKTDLRPTEPEFGREAYLEMCREYERMWGVTGTENRFLYDEAGRPR
jgi:hypothetical protein